MGLQQERVEAVAAVMAEVRAIEAADGVTTASVAKMQAALVPLTTRTGLFSEADFPNPPEGQPARLYLLSEDADGRFPIYLACANPGGAVRPHNHGTWAVVAGVSGLEENTYYDRATGGAAPGPATLTQREVVQVCPGESTGMLPDAVHSVATPGDVPRRHFHMYGLSLERLPKRLAWDTAAGTCAYMEINPKIVRPD